MSATQVTSAAKYRKKPVVIDAIQYTGENTQEVVTFTGHHAEPDASMKDGQLVKFLVIHTLEGSMTADVGDFIIRGVQGEYYPCKPDIFGQTYEKAE